MQNKDIRDAKKKKEEGGFSFDPKKSGTIESYTIKEGDNLRTIAEKVYGDPETFEKIYEANKEAIGPDANMIKVGQELKIPPK